MPTTVTITPVDVAQAVADEINLPASLAIWTQAFAPATQEWLPAYDDSQLATLQIAVVPIVRNRERREQKGSARGVLASEHTVRIIMQQLIDPTAGLLKTAVQALAAFLNQVDDYFMAAHRKLNQVAGHTVGSDNVYCVRSRVVQYSPKDLDSRKLWDGEIEATFAERTAW
jgi:hypothetical protein